MWWRWQIIPLIRKIEAIAPRYGYHVALTGGLLYKRGRRKDADIMFYAIRQGTPDETGLLLALEKMGFILGGRFGWVQKARWGGYTFSYARKHVDFFFVDQDVGVIDRKDPYPQNELRGEKDF